MLLPTASCTRCHVAACAVRGALRRALFALSLCLFAPALLAQDVNQGDVSALANAVRESTALTDEARAPLLVTLQEATAALEKADGFEAETARIQQAIADSDAEIDRYREQVEDMEASPPSVERRLGRNPDLTEIEAEIDIVEAQRRTLNQQRDTEQESAEKASKGDAPLQARLVEVRSEIDGITPRANATDSLEDRVKDLAAAARLRALQAEESKLKLELRAAPTLNAIRTARLTWLEVSIARSEALLQLLQDAAAQRRQSAAQQRMRDIDRLLAQLAQPSEPVARFAAGNRQLLREQQSLGEGLEAVRRRVASLRDQLEYTEEDAKLTARRMDVAGISGELGEVMLTRLTSLPDTREIETGIDERNARIATVSVQTIDTEEELRTSTDRSAFLRAQFPELDNWPRGDRRVLDRLYEQRRDLLRENLDAQNTLLRLLVDGNQVAEDLIATTRAYQQFLTGNLLWIRNYAYADPARLVDQVAAIIDPAPYLAMLPRLQELLGRPLLIFDVIVLLLLLAYGPRLRRAQTELLERPIRPREESIGKILKGLALTFARVLPLPLTLVIVAGAPLHLGSGEPELEALGQGLRAGAFMLLCLSFVRSISARTGVGRRLLKWNGPKVEALRRDLVWFVPLTSSAVGVAVFGHVTLPTESGGAVAAAATLFLALALLVFSVRLLMSGQFTVEALARYALRGVVLLSAAIVVMHLSGQLFAAHMYLKALGWTIGAGITVLLVTNILHRWILIYEGRLSRQQREEQQAAAVAAASAEADGASPEAVERPAAGRAEDSSEQDLEAVASLSDAQTRLLGLARLLAIGSLLWVIWSPALPAINVLDEVALWTTVDPTLPEGELRTVSLATLILVALVIIVTALLTRHLPPLVQVVLMEYSKASVGARYAAGMLLQYVIIGVGASMAMSMLGFAWSKVQWLVAALGVGIGFGLQEIVANFISGIILLFERPIRPGDLISVSGYDGTVLKINPRATVIETFERKEVIVPNKELITGVVNNWSLSTSTLRGVIPVGVAYGSDVRRVMEILYAVARDEPRVLDEPAPMVTFEDFGDNALTLWLRCYASSDYLQIWTDLRSEIYDRLNAAGIGIAFPQRDVHLDASAPIPVTVVRGDEPRAGD
jgi:potassium efflux system protein